MVEHKPPDDDLKPQAQRASSVPGHEPDATSVRAVGVFLVVLLIVCVLTAAMIGILFGSFELRAVERDPPPSPFVQPGPPQPRLQEDERRHLEQHRRQQQHLLDSYGWVDREQGVVRIPIDEAMRLYLEQQQHEQEQEQTTPSP